MAKLTSGVLCQRESTPTQILPRHPTAVKHLRTENQVACSTQAQAQINNVATSDVRPRPAKVGHRLDRRSDFLEGVGQHGQALRI